MEVGIAQAIVGQIVKGGSLNQSAEGACSAKAYIIQ
jgi:hypothetical protein